MELFGRMGDFCTSQKTKNKETSEVTGTTLQQHFARLTHLQTKTAFHLGKSIAQLRQLQRRLLNLARPQFEKAQAAQKKHDHIDFEDICQEIDYWENSGEGHIYKAMIKQARMEIQRWYGEYKDVTLKREALQQPLAEEGINPTLGYPAGFLNFDEFQQQINTL